MPAVKRISISGYKKKSKVDGPEKSIFHPFRVKFEDIARLHPKTKEKLKVKGYG